LLMDDAPDGLVSVTEMDREDDLKVTDCMRGS
jgi:hypothetical protein